MIKEIAHLLTSPINQTLLLVIIVWLISLKSNVSRVVIKTSYIAAFLWLYLCSQPFFSYMLMQPIESSFPPIKANDKKWQSADAIWVLACSHYNNEELPDVSRWNNCALDRLVHTYMMYREKPTTVVLTGGDFSEEGGFEYAERAKSFLILLGIEESDILSLPKGTNTYEELEALKEGLITKNIAVVSSASHGRRLSVLLDSQTDYTYTFIPVEHLNVLPSPFNLGLPQIASIEKSRRTFYTYFANIELWIKGY